MFRDVVEQRDARLRIERITPHQRMQGERRLLRRHSLAKARFEMRMAAQRVELSRRQLIEVRLRDPWDSHHDGVRGEIAKALRASADDARDAAHEVEDRQHVHEPKEIADDHLAGLHAEPLHVHNAQTQDALADGLPALEPLEANPVADHEHELEQHSNRLSEAFCHEIEQREQHRDSDRCTQHDAEIDEPREEAGHRPGQQLREDDAFRRANEKRAGLAHAPSAFFPQRPRNRHSRTSSVRPKAIFTT